jgi:hypothetical protein
MCSVFIDGTINMSVEAFVGYIFEAEQPFLNFSQNMPPTPTWLFNRFPTCFCTVTYKLNYIMVLNPHKKTDLILKCLMF